MKWNWSGLPPHFFNSCWTCPHVYLGLDQELCTRSCTDYQWRMECGQCWWVVILRGVSIWKLENQVTHIWHNFPAMRTYDLEDKVVGTVGAGRIGFRVLQRLLPFQCKELVYFDYQSLAPGKPINAYEVIPITTYVKQKFSNIMDRTRTGSWSQENRIFWWIPSQVWYHYHQLPSVWKNSWIV